MDATRPKYDVAISFLSKDEPIAAAFYERLSDGLEVFFYPRNQEDLAGTDGLESMRTPFLDGSRVVAVLYRQPWGKTPWTRVEQTAIQESCLNHGWNRLFFVVLDNTSSLPKWLPQTHVRFNYDFGLEQAVGAIKLRVQDCGGIVAPLTAVKRADLYKQDTLYLEDRKRMSSYEGMERISEKVLELITEIQRLCSEINASGNISIRVGANPGRCVLTDNRISLIVGWRQPYANSMDRCALKVLEYNMQMALPDERLMYPFGEPTLLRETNFLPELSRAREYGWVQEGKPQQFLSSVALADRCVVEFLNLAGRADRGEIELEFGATNFT
jgi:hypothetical protein